MEKLTQQNFNEKTSEGYILVDFFATWCGPCRMLHPVLEEISNEGKVTVFQVDVDEVEGISKEYGVMSIPTLILMKDGKELSRKVGFHPKEEIVNWIEDKA